MNTSGKTQGEGQVIVNQRCVEASLSQSSIASEGPLSFSFLLTAMYRKNQPIAVLHEIAAPSPFPAALTGIPQLAENKTTLSLAFGTLTDYVKLKSCICHSYKKQVGVGGGFRSSTCSTSSTSSTSFTTTHSSNPALRSFASTVFGETPSFSEARVLFHLHSRKVLSSSTRSMWPTALPVTSSRLPSQLNCSGNMPAGNWSVSGFVGGSCNPSAVILRPSVRITARSMVFCNSRTFPGQR